MDHSEYDFKIVSTVPCGVITERSEKIQDFKLICKKLTGACSRKLKESEVEPPNAYQYPRQFLPPGHVFQQPLQVGEEYQCALAYGTLSRSGRSGPSAIA